MDEFEESESISNLWQKISDLKTCMQNVLRFKSNKYYLNKERELIVGLNRFYKIFKIKLETIQIHNSLQEKLVKLDSDISTLLSEIDRQNKVDLIDKLELFWPEFELEFTKEKLEMKSKVFSDELIKTLGETFTTELKDFNLVYGKSGTLTAFLLRKILEKILIITLRKNGLEDDKLKDNQGKYFGLNSLLEIAASTKIKNEPLLTPHTYGKVDGIKFLGDTAAHNPFVSVEMEEIVPQMPFIITALKELARFF